MKWDKHKKPPAGTCPGKYCFYWIPPGRFADLSGRAYDSLDQTTIHCERWVEFPHGGCTCTYGRCTRFDPTDGDRDRYEPCEPELENDGLPWFYFIASIENLDPEFHEKYLVESRELWGDEQDCADCECRKTEV
jgi:hypothetical protein